MGSTAATAGDAGRAGTSGRHRRTGATAAWTPPITPVIDRPQTDHSRDLFGPVLSGDLVPPAPATATAPPPDRMVDSGRSGLSTFNLGSIPASVTPPRSWRRAAWFMIFASMAALCGLLMLTATLVRPAQTADHIALPDLPTGPRLADLDQTPNPTRNPEDANRSGLRAETTGPGAPSNLADGPVSGALGAGDLPSGSGVALTPGLGIGAPTGTPTVGTGPAPVTTVTGGGPPSADPGTLANRTQTFFKEVTTDVSAAADLTAGTVRDDAAAIIEQHYGDIAAIQVQSISLDPARGLTVSLLKVTDKDGTTSTQQTTLQFTLGEDPRIQNPGG